MIAALKEKYYNEATINPYYNQNNLDKPIALAWLICVPCAIFTFFLSF